MPDDRRGHWACTHLRGEGICEGSVDGDALVVSGTLVHPAPTMWICGKIETGRRVDAGGLVSHRGSLEDRVDAGGLWPHQGGLEDGGGLMGTHHEGSVGGGRREAP